MKVMTQRQAFLKFVGADEQKPVMSYGKALALKAMRDAEVSAAPSACVVPTKSGFDCEGRVIEGEQFCGPHKRVVGRALIHGAFGLPIVAGDQ